MNKNKKSGNNGGKPTAFVRNLKRKKKKMKRKKGDRGFLFTVIWVALATLVIAVFPTEAEASIYEDTLRLHIRARSDSEKDQQIKLEIRDRVLENFTEYIRDMYL